MSYVEQTWADGTVGGTPLSAARLAYMEAGIVGRVGWNEITLASAFTLDSTFLQWGGAYNRTDTGTATIPTGLPSDAWGVLSTINTGRLEIVGQVGVTFIAKRGQILRGAGSVAQWFHLGANVILLVGDLDDGYGEEVVWRYEFGNPGTGAVTITSTGEVTQFLFPIGIRLYEGFAGIQLESVVPSSSGLFRIDVEMPPGTSIFSTRPSMDVGEDTSETAAAPVVIATRDIPARSRVSIDVDDTGTDVVAPAIVFAGRKLLS